MIFTVKIPRSLDAASASDIWSARYICVPALADSEEHAIALVKHSLAHKVDWWPTDESGITAEQQPAYDPDADEQPDTAQGAALDRVWVVYWQPWGESGCVIEAVCATEEAARGVVANGSFGIEYTIEEWEVTR